MATSKLRGWRDNLMPASFRGVPFFVESHEFSCGRWVDVEEKVNPNGPSWIWITDKGGEAEYFDIEGYVIQSAANDYDYFKNRDDLMKAVSVGRNMDNSGTLIHPYLGTRAAFAVGDQKFSESVSEGGVCKVKLRFVWDTRQNIMPVTTSKPGLADAAALNAKNNALDISALVTSGLNQDSLADAIYNGMVFINSAFARIKGGISSVVARAQGTVALFFTTIDTLISQPCAIMNMFYNTAGAFEDICGLGAEGIEQRVLGACSGAEKGAPTILDGTFIPEILGDSIATALTDIVSTDVDVSGLPTSQQTNATLMLEGSNLILAATVARVLARTDYASRLKYQAAIKAFSDALAALKSRLSESDLTTDLFQSAEDLRVGFFNASQKKLADMNTQVEYIVPATAVTTSLVLAYNRYMDIDRASEIQLVNANVRHPGFLPQRERIYLNNE